MKKLLTFITVITLLGVTFVSCQKESVDSTENYIRIMGEFTVGDSTFTSPIFNLGSPALHVGYLSPMDSKEVNMIRIEPDSALVVDNDIVLTTITSMAALKVSLNHQQTLQFIYLRKLLDFGFIRMILPPRLPK